MKITDKERRLWVLNDEGLYNQMIRTGSSDVYKFIKNNRDEIDKIINNVTSGKKQAHYKAYER